jgi:hypothetical protein
MTLSSQVFAEVVCPLEEPSPRPLSNQGSQPCARGMATTYSPKMPISSSRSFAVCRLAVVPVRRLPDMTSEMTTQVRFGEGVEVMEEHHRMWRVRLCHDGYEGWVDSRQFTVPQPDRPSAIKVLSGKVMGWAARDGERRLLPRGSPLPGFEAGCFWIGKEAWHWKGKVHHIPEMPDWQALLSESRYYLHAPYFWGGRTLWGIDCSGLVQTLLGHQGVGIPRDCVDQIEAGTAIRGLPESRPGDLAFFEGVRDGGRHVGLVLDGGQLLHASGCVRVDDLTDRGIVVRETGYLSHRLTALRRIVEWERFAS